MLHCAFLPLEINSNKSIFVWAGECLESHLWAGSVVVGWQCGSETLKGSSYICLRRRLSGVTPLRWSRSRRMTMRLGDPESGLFSYSCLRLRLFKVVPLRWICSCRLSMRTLEWSRTTGRQCGSATLKAASSHIFASAGGCLALCISLINIGGDTDYIHKINEYLPSFILRNNCKTFSQILKYKKKGVIIKSH